MRARASQLAPGTTVLLSGKVGLHRGRKQLSNPRLYVLDELDEAEREALLARPMPIYPGTEALPSWLVAKAVRIVLDQLEPGDVADPIPEELRREVGLVDAYTAYRWVHRPEVLTSGRPLEVDCATRRPSSCRSPWLSAEPIMRRPVPRSPGPYRRRRTP